MSATSCLRSRRRSWPRRASVVGWWLRPRLDHAGTRDRRGSSLDPGRGPGRVREDDRCSSLVESSDIALAWLTLDAGDNDPARLWTYVATASTGFVTGWAGERCTGFGCPGWGSRPRRRAHERDRGVRRAVRARARRPSHGHRRASAWRPLNSRSNGCPRGTSDRDHPGRSSAGARAVTRARRAGELRASDLAFTAAEARELLVDRAGLDLDGASSMSSGAHRGLAGRAVSRGSLAANGPTIEIVPCSSSVEIIVTSPSISPRRCSRRLTLTSVRSCFAWPCSAISRRRCAMACLAARIRRRCSPSLRSSNLFVLRLERRELVPGSFAVRRSSRRSARVGRA